MSPIFTHLIVVNLGHKNLFFFVPYHVYSYNSNLFHQLAWEITSGTALELNNCTATTQENGFLGQVVMLYGCMVLCL